MPVLCVGRLKEERLNKLVNKKQLKNDGDVDEKKKRRKKLLYDDIETAKRIRKKYGSNNKNMKNFYESYKLVLETK
jgi:hypothetical protein